MTSTPTPHEATAAAAVLGDVRTREILGGDLSGATPAALRRLVDAAGECDECGEAPHPGQPCRTPEEILAECAPPDDYTARFRAERAAAIDAADARRPGRRPPATPAPVVPADVAAAIRDQVLPAALIDNSSPLERCDCQYGPCGHCAAGRHRRCAHRHHQPNPPVPHTYLTTAAGMVVNGHDGQVWTVGRPCRWVCPCPTCRNPRPPAAEILAPGNPPARRRSTREALTLLDAGPRTAPPARRRPAAPARPRTNPEAPTLF